MVKKRILSAAAILLTVSSLHADWASYANDAVTDLSDSYTTTSVSAHSFKTKTTSGASGGSIRVRWKPLGNINPIHVEPPRMSVGCNGLDLSMGSFSYLNFDELVGKLKQISAAAPAFAFKMAIDTVCSQCSSIMQDIEEIVDDINSMTLDSCAIAQSAGDFAGRALGDSINNAMAYGSQDGYKARKEAHDDREASLAAGWNNLKTEANTIASDYGVKAAEAFLAKETMYGSLLHNAAQKANTMPGLNRKDFIEAARAIVGDIVVYVPNGAEPKVEFVGGGASIEQYYNTVMYGDKNFKPVKVVLRDSHNTDVTDNPYTNMPTKMDNPQVISSGITTTNNFVEKAKVMVKNIVTKLKAKQSLDSMDKNFIFNMPFNGYTIINMAVLERGNLDIDYIGEYIGTYFAHQQIIAITSETQRIAVEYTQSNAPKDKEVKEAIVRFIETLNSKSNEITSYFNPKLKDYEDTLKGAVGEKKEVLKEKSSEQ